MKKYTSKKKISAFLLALTIFFVACLSFATVFAIQDPDFPNYFYITNTKPTINLTFSTDVSLEPNQLSRGTGQFPLAYDSGYLRSFGVGIQDPFYLAPSDIFKLDTYYSYLFNAKSRKGSRLDENQNYFIILDNVRPSVSIYPNGPFFSKTNDPNLTFSITGSERINLVSVKINNEDFTSFDMSRYLKTFSKKQSEMNNVSKQVFTKDGVKNISVVVKDLAQNQGFGSSIFTINANPDLVIFLAKPKYGKVSNNTFSFIVGTDNSADCEFIFDRENIPYGSMEKLSKDNTGTKHTKSGFGISDQDEGHYLWVGCNDPFWKQTTYAKLSIGVDSIPPRIVSAYALPDSIVEPPMLLENLHTILYVNTDKDTICRYDEFNNSYDKMSNAFDASETFTTVHAVQLNLSSSDAKNYTYHVSCISRSELETNKVDITFFVDLNAKLKIIQLTPKYVNSTQVKLKVQTNKNSTCLYSASQVVNENNTLNFLEDTGYIFSTDVNVDGAGNYSYPVLCSAKKANEKTNILAKFMVDLTPPEMIYVNDSSPLLDDPEYYYSTSALRVNYFGYDLDSGIKKYSASLSEKSGNYSFFGPFDNFNSETFGTWIFIRNLNLTNLKTYFFSITATNQADLASDAMQSDGVTIDITKVPEYCLNQVFDIGKESDIDCGQTCPQCGGGKKCGVNEDCISLFCKQGFCTQATCLDGLKNQGEGDVDCGGPCDPCIDGRTCNKDQDCFDVSLCEDGLCKYQPDTCRNRRIDGGETDLNCGGDRCVKCLPGNACLVNNDCTSNDCQNGKCNDATCTDSKKNQDESDVDCGGEKCQKCVASKNCLKNSDCESGFCNDLVCNQYSQDEQQTRDSKRNKIILFSLLLFVLVAILSGGGYYAYQKGYVVEAVDYFDNFDWKTLKPKPKPFKPIPSKPLSQEELRKRDQINKMMLERMKKDQEKKSSERKGVMNAFGFDKKESVGSSQAPQIQKVQTPVKAQVKKEKLEEDNLNFHKDPLSDLETFARKDDKDAKDIKLIKDNLKNLKKDKK